MVVVRNCFVAKPGNASKLAAQLKEAVLFMKLPNARVMTDVTGDFNRVIMEFEAQNMGEVESRMHQYSTDPGLREKMKGYTDFWATGSREILQIV